METNMKLSRSAKSGLMYLLLIALSVMMIYPLIWMVGASFKENSEIFSSIGFIPKKFVWDSYALGWAGIGQFTFGRFFLNTFKLVIPTVVFTVVSSLSIGYGFARFPLPGKKILMMLMISTLMLPNTVVIIPRYILFKNLGWLDSYLPFIIPALLGTYSFFNYMIVQFIRGIPRELDESATIDGCGPLRILVSILLPLCKPAIFSVIIFQTIWRWNDFFNVLIYVSSVSKFPVSLGLRMTLDNSSKADWNQIMAMSVVSIVPLIVLFFSAQKYFVEGIATKGLKG